MGARASFPSTHSYQQQPTVSVSELVTSLTNVQSLSSLPLALIELISQYGVTEWYIFIILTGLLDIGRTFIYMSKWPLTSSTKWIRCPDLHGLRHHSLFTICGGSLMTVGGVMDTSQHIHARTMESLSIHDLQFGPLTFKNVHYDSALASLIAVLPTTYREVEHTPPISSFAQSTSMSLLHGTCQQWNCETPLPIAFRLAYSPNANHDATLVMVPSSSSLSSISDGYSGQMGYTPHYVFNTSRTDSSSYYPSEHYVYNMVTKEWSTIEDDPTVFGRRDRNYQSQLTISYNNDGCIYFFSQSSSILSFIV
jgi:hypothetical protein